jgi:hypothetical protein
MASCSTDPPMATEEKVTITSRADTAFLDKKIVYTRLAQSNLKHQIQHSNGMVRLHRIVYDLAMGKLALVGQLEALYTQQKSDFTSETQLEIGRIIGGINELDIMTEEQVKLKEHINKHQGKMEKILSVLEDLDRTVPDQKKITQWILTTQGANATPESVQTLLNSDQ